MAACCSYQLVVWLGGLAAFAIAWLLMHVTTSEESSAELPASCVAVDGVAEYHGTYHSYEEMVARLQQLAAEHDAVELRYKGDMVVLTLDSQRNPHGGKPQVWIQGGLHPCEWIGPHVVMQYVDYLLSHPDVSRLAEWHLVPVIDPDAYAITWTRDRFWKSTSSGINLNTNFPFMWGNMSPPMKILAYFFPELLSVGETAASEDAARNLIGELKDMPRLRLFLDLHAFGEKWLYPWGYTTEASAHRKQHEVASSLAVAAVNNASCGVRKYSAIPVASMEAPFGGTAVDYVYGEIGCIHSYVVELPPAFPRSILGALVRGVAKRNLKWWWEEGMQLPKENAVSVGQEMCVAISALAKHVLEGV